MSSNFPVSPPTSESPEGTYSLHRLAQRNATTHHQDQWNLEAADYLPSGSTSSFNSPQPAHTVLDHFGRAYPSNPSTIMDSGDSYSLDIYGNPVYPSYHNSTYYLTPPPQEVYSENHQRAATSTPGLSDRSTGRRETKRLRNSNKHTTQAPIKKSSKKVKNQGDQKASITEPLSKMTKDMAVPLKDIEAIVNRSTEERRRAVVKRNGNIPRWQNSFVLYRSAYADRVNALAKEINHQNVSKIAGESWNMETPEIRDLYEEYSKIDKENHAKAHPGYKFKPAKTLTAGRKRKGVDSDEEDDLSDLTNADAEWTPPGGRRVKRSKRTDDEADHQYWSAAQSHPYNYSGHAASYAYSGQPGLMYHQSPYHQHYQGVVHPVAQALNMEDSFAQHSQPSTDHLEIAGETIGLPGIDPYMLSEDHSEPFAENNPVLTTEPQVDPDLSSWGHDLDGRETQGPASAGLHGLDDIHAFNTSHEGAGDGR